MTPALTSTTPTAPVELRARFEALRVFEPRKVIPALPDVRLAVAAFSAAAPPMPEEPLLALSVKDVPEEAPRLMFPALVSTIETAPVEFAVRLEAVTEPPALIVTPPVPALIDKVGAVIVDVLETEPAPPGVATSVSEVATVCGVASAIEPFVEVRETTGALSLFNNASPVIGPVTVVIAAPWLTARDVTPVTVLPREIVLAAPVAVRLTTSPEIAEVAPVAILVPAERVILPGTEPTALTAPLIDNEPGVVSDTEPD